MNEQLFDLPESQKLWHLARQQMTDHAVATGRTFTLSSGRESDFYVDCRVAALMQPEEFALGWLASPLGRLMDRALGKCNISGRFKCWAPVPLGGLLLMLRSEVHAPPIVVPRSEQKEHGMKHKVEGLLNAKDRRLVPPGTDTLVIEDVITTGGSTLRAVEALREVDLNPTTVLVLVDREEGGREALEAADLEVWPVFTQRDLR
jgi:orotate phosphoribosyltransferase